MDERDRILVDLRRWVKQQQRSGVERVVLRHDESAPLLAAASPEEPSDAPMAAPMEASSTDQPGAKAKAKAPSLFAAEPQGGAPPSSGPGLDPPEDPSLRALLLERHPAWADSELLPLAESIAACQACSLAAGRLNTVPGVGHPRARLVFVGEAPGAEEDRQGIPFVGRAGQLLDKILAAIDLSREDVHILNILKCRPPENRNPAPDEITACRHHLESQIRIIQPRILVALGLFAAQWLTGRKLSLTKLRQSGPYEYMGIPVYATYHPAALLRNPNWKRPAWEDFQRIQEEVKQL